MPSKRSTYASFDVESLEEVDSLLSPRGGSHDDDTFALTTWISRNRHKSMAILGVLCIVVLGVLGTRRGSLDLFDDPDSTAGSLVATTDLFSILTFPELNAVGSENEGAN